MLTSMVCFPQTGNAFVHALARKLRELTIKA
jgi:hypothetical protein